MFLLLAVIATIVVAIFLENSFDSTCRTHSGGVRLSAALH
jgi:hypothetical protein